MEQSHEQFLKIFYLSPMAMVISSLKESRIIEVNDSFTDFVEYSSNEIIGQTSFGLKLWVDLNERERVVKRLSEEGKVENWETKFRTKSGRIKNVVFSVFQVKFIDDKDSVVVGMMQDVTELKKVQEALIISQGILEDQKILLEQKNAALREMVSYVEMEKNNVKKDVVANIGLLIPILDKIRMKRDAQKNLLNLIKSGLEDITSSFGKEITQGAFKLTSREIEICNMIKSGFSTKEIASALNISSQTIEKHRKNIRKKMGLSHTSTNLFSHLKTV